MLTRFATREALLAVRAQYNRSAVHGQLANLDSMRRGLDSVLHRLDNLLRKG